MDSRSIFPHALGRRPESESDSSLRWPLKRVEGKRPLDDNFQHDVAEWLIDCFGREIASDRRERLHRFLEEALELAQAGGCTRDEAAQLLDYVFSRPLGRVADEAGGVMVTLAGACEAYSVSMKAAAEQELARNRNRTHAIRAKRARKITNSSLPC